MNNNNYLSKYIRSFFEDYLVCRRNLSNATIKSYRDAIKLFLNFITIHTKKSVVTLLVTDIKESMIIDFLTHLENSRHNLIQTRNHRLTILRRLFSYISLQEPMLSEYCRKIMDIPSKRVTEIPEVGYLEKEEMEAMFNAIDTKTILGRRDYAVLLFMYNTGARVQETSDACISWISFGTPYKVRILGKGSKWRTCPLWKSTVEILQKYVDEHSAQNLQDGRLFLNRRGEPLSRFGIWNILEKYKNKAALKTSSLRNKKITPHTIRHTTAMHLLQSGVDINVIRSWLGHANLATTHRYAEIDLAMKRKALESCEPTKEINAVKCWRSSPDILTWLNSL